MKRFAVVCGLVLAASAAADDAQGLKDLEGTYKVTYAEKGGEPADKATLDSLTFVFKGDELALVIEQKDSRVEKKAKIKIDTEKTPHALDVVPSEGPEKGKTFPAIFKLEKGQLTIAYAEKGGRPKDFKADGDVYLLKLRKDEKKDDKK